MTFTKINCVVMYRGKIILKGHKDVNTGLWTVNLQGSKQVRTIANPYIPAINKIANNLPKSPDKDQLEDSLQLAASALEFLLHKVGPREVLFNLIKTSLPKELAMFSHQVLCSPPKSTLLKAIKNG